MQAFKYIFGFGLLVVLFAGIYAFKNFKKWCGPDADIPSETDSARLYNKSQFILIWLLAMKLMLMMFYAF